VPYAICPELERSYCITEAASFSGAGTSCFDLRTVPFPAGRPVDELSHSGVPRTADGKPDLGAACPRSADGKQDLSGVWEMHFAVTRHTSLSLAQQLPAPANATSGPQSPQSHSGTTARFLAGANFFFADLPRFGFFKSILPAAFLFSLLFSIALSTAASTVFAVTPLRTAFFTAFSIDMTAFFFLPILVVTHSGFPRAAQRPNSV
jgi:hypothetical protein